MKSFVFEGDARERYEALRTRDKVLYRKRCAILEEMQRGDPAVGTGEPEPPKHGLSGLWSRRLSGKDRLVYGFDDRAVYIFALGGHYEDRQDRRVR